ncbi:pro-Pol polyprotein [Trichonephila clavipes]|nr:pro-Pol polyprotein [Trichonephila clavipes]
MGISDPRAGTKKKYEQNLTHVSKKVRYPCSIENVPLSTYHVDFIGPLPSTNKSYQHIFSTVDAFTKYTWLYPIKTVSAESALEKLKLKQKTFGNPIRMISDRGSTFTLRLFNNYWTEENIQQLQMATGIPRENGQVERIHRTFCQTYPFRPPKGGWNEKHSI